ncbi:DNA polymerase III subunit delta' [Dietzia aurantiaca]|uniref:DNA polymerase III subunit delta' n=1 Tax=Dietzia aurantiaca TaxID=983873 RepID=UPI001E2FE315|nr:DNA polymerase III subunit delta' [Dietzia aurantiaca]MCD2262785.1 DNA polymerase III subunit delta' [Dietzia aurantiaca]
MSGVFDRLAGQAEAVAELTAAATAARLRVPGQGWDESDARMVHAWLFTGPPGSGRSVAAMAFAAALQCEHPEIVGCGECRACHTVLAGTHADVHLLAPQGVNILLKDVKETIHRAASRPGTGRWQIVVVEEADRLTEQSGNALLKVVEEPPSRTVFLLCSPTTDPMDIMVTLRSRSRNVTLRQPDAQAVERALLADGSIDPERARWAASVSSGHVGRARWLATDEATRERREVVLQLPMVMHNPGRAFPLADQLVKTAEQEAIARNTESDEREVEELRTALGAGGTGKGTASAGRGASGAVKELERAQKSRRTRSTRDSLDLALVDLAGFYRDALTAAIGARDVAPVHADKADEAARLGGHYSAASILMAIEAVQDCRSAIEVNVKPKFAVFAMVGAIRAALT